MLLRPGLLWIGLLLGLAGCSPTTAQTNPDVAIVQSKLKLAVPFFNRVWSQALTARGLKFAPPRIHSYTESFKSECGPIDPGNAEYCSRDNTIYIDAAFLAGMMKNAADTTRTDGDYAAIVVVAHEFGHLLQHQLGTTKYRSFNEEQAADCFAGAITREAKTGRYLEAGDLEEARFAMATAGDPVARTILGEMVRKLQPGAHGDRTDRYLAFDRGFYVGAQACSSAMGAATLQPGGRILNQQDFTHIVPQHGTWCSVFLANGELVVTNIGNKDDENCFWSVGDFGTLPDNFRIEVSVRQLEGSIYRGAGLFFGPPLDAVGASYAGVVRAEGSYAMYQVEPRYGLVDFLVDSNSDESTLMVSKGYGAQNRLTLDVHRQQSSASVLFYVNGKYVGMNEAVFGWVSRTGEHHERIGLYLQLPGMRAAFSSFRVVALLD